jgi:hypothetical protein
MEIALPEMSPAHRAGIDQALAQHDETKRLDTALDKQLLVVSASKTRSEISDKALAVRDTDLALALDDKSARTIENDVKRLANEAAEARLDVERQERIERAIRDRLTHAEERLAIEKEKLQKLKVEHASAVMQAIAAHVAEVSAPFIDALRLLYVTSTATGNGYQQLSEMSIPDLRGNGHLVRDQHVYVEGAALRLDDIGESPLLQQLSTLAREPQRAFAQVSSYTARASRERFTLPAKSRGITI